MSSTSLLWGLFIIGGFFSGSIMNCSLLPRQLLNMDIASISSDHNPGAANVFIQCGVPLGLTCLFLDMAKGFVPVFLATRYLDYHCILFAFGIAAPVLGHAVAPLNHFNGGKCIATSFGVVLGLLPITPIVWLLAFLYIIFSTIVKINPNRVRSIVTFVLFGGFSFAILSFHDKYSIALGCLLLSLTAIFKHTRYCMKDDETHIET